MTEVLHERPAEPAVKGKTHGGFADIARRLNALHPERPIPYSRQLAERWYKCRVSNRFPDRKPVQLDNGKTELLFDLRVVERWHASRRRTRAANPPIETIPLFPVDARGSAVAASDVA